MRAWTRPTRQCSTWHECRRSWRPRERQFLWRKRLPNESLRAILSLFLQPYFAWCITVRRVACARARRAARRDAAVRQLEAARGSSRQHLHSSLGLRSSLHARMEASHEAGDAQDARPADWQRASLARPARKPRRQVRIARAAAIAEVEACNFFCLSRLAGLPVADCASSVRRVCA